MSVVLLNPISSFRSDGRTDQTLLRMPLYTYHLALVGFPLGPKMRQGWLMEVIIGPFSCAGKQLALMEIRRVTVDLLSQYDVSFAKGQTHEAFYQGQQDVFTLVCGELQLLFTERVSE
jgi:hypothetical protein